MGWLDDIAEAIGAIPKAIQDGLRSVVPPEWLPPETGPWEKYTPFDEDEVRRVAPKVAASVVFVSYARMYVQSLALVEFIRRGVKTGSLAKDFALLKSEIASIDFDAFREAWKVARQLVP